MSSSHPSKGQTKVKQRKRPLKADTDQYVEGLTPRLKPIIPPKIALEGAERAFPIAAGHSARIANAMSDDALKQRPTDIAKDYWDWRARHDQIGRQQISHEVAKIEKAAAAFLQTLENTPNYARTFVNRQMLLEAPVGERQDGLKSTLEMLKHFLRACQRIPKVTGRRGTREKRYAEITARALVHLWSEMSGQPFIFNLDAYPDDGSPKAFVHDGPLFVQKIIEAIDPEAPDANLPFQEVLNALRKVSKSRNTSSENSA